MTATITTTSTDAAVAVTVAHRESGRWVLADGISLTEFGATTGVTARVGAQAPFCAPPPCGTATRSGVTVNLRAAAGDVVFLGLDHATLSSVHLSRGWTVRKRATGFARVSGADGNWAAAVAPDGSTVAAATMTSATVQTRSRLAIGFAALPCEAVGYGTAHFSGPAFDQALSCQDLPGDVEVAHRPGVWSLTGNVTGITGIRTRLAVLDTGLT